MLTYAAAAEGPKESRALPTRAAKASGVGGFNVVGRRVEVWWDGERQWFAGETVCVVNYIHIYLRLVNYVHMYIVLRHLLAGETVCVVN